jgi:hypothetical protein
MTDAEIVSVSVIVSRLIWPTDQASLIDATLADELLARAQTEGFELPIGGSDTNGLVDGPEGRRRLSPLLRGSDPSGG